MALRFILLLLTIICSNCLMAQDMASFRWDYNGKRIHDSLMQALPSNKRTKTAVIDACDKFCDSINKNPNLLTQEIKLREYMAQKYRKTPYATSLMVDLADAWLDFSIQFMENGKTAKMAIDTAHHIINSIDTTDSGLNLKYYYCRSRYYTQFRNYLTALAYTDTCEAIVEGSGAMSRYAGLSIYQKGRIFTYLNMDNEAIEYLKKSLLYYDYQKRYHLAITSAGRICKYMCQHEYSDAEIEYYHNLFTKVYPKKSVDAGNDQDAVNCRMNHFDIDYLEYKGRYKDAYAAEQRYFHYLDHVLSYMEYPEKKQFDAGDVFDMTFRVKIYDNLGYHDSIDYIYNKFKTEDSNIYPDEYADLFRQLGIYYRGHKQYRKAVECFDRSTYYYRQWKDTTDCFKMLVNAAESAIGCNDIPTAQARLDSTASILPSAIKFPTYELVNFYEDRAFTNYVMGRKDDFERDLCKACDLFKSVTNDYFGYNMLESDLINNINKYTSRAVNFVYCVPGISDSLKVKVFNMLLIQNNVNFISQRSLQNNLTENADIQKMYTNIVLLKHFYTDKDLSASQRDSVHAIIQDMEHTLINSSDAYSFFRSKMAQDFNTVKDSLWDGSVAVVFTKIFEYDEEFASNYPQYCTHPYMAFAFSNKSVAPQIIRMFTQDELDRYLSSHPSDIYSDTTFTKSVWGGITGRFPDTRSIFFSPSGDLHKIAIEYLSTGKRTMSDDYYIARLSSINNISDKSTKFELGDNILLISDVNYDLPVSKMQELANLYFPSGSIPRYCYRAFTPITDSIAYKESGDYCYRTETPTYQYLPSSKEEADYISANSQGRNVLYLSGDNATEEAAKHHLMDTHSIVHIATHGYTRLSENKSAADIMNGGLIMAGANNLARGLAIPDNVDDGYLTAKEISELHLDGNQLVVLSACETGLGHIDSNGLFGLMRAFKLSGARTVIVSLGPIADEATSLFMRRFYKNLMLGNSPRQSLRLAQNYLRNGDRFSNPFFWANFVIID